jgi:hypothetical protein
MAGKSGCNIDVPARKKWAKRPRKEPLSPEFYFV